MAQSFWKFHKHIYIFQFTLHKPHQGRANTPYRYLYQMDRPMYCRGILPKKNQTCVCGGTRLFSIGKSML